MKKHLFLLLATPLFLLGCGKSNEELLVGTWKEIETGESILIYNENHTYDFSYVDGRKEKGTWRIDGDILYSTEEGSEEELNETLSEIDEKQLTVVIADMFQTKYKRVQ